MTVQHHYKAFLRQISSTGTGSGQISHPLSTSQSIVIGRDPSCQIVLDSIHYKGVSRHHVEIRPMSGISGSPLWEACDLGSANHTYINGQLLQGCRTLQVGDYIKLGRDGPEFVFECPSVPYATPVANLQVIPPTVYENSSLPQSPSPPSSIPWKTIAGILAAVAVVFLLSRQPSPQPTSQAPPTSPETPSAPATPPETTSAPDSSRVSVNTEVLDPYFNIVSELKKRENVQITRSSGETFTADIIVFEVEAKSSFDNSAIEFIVHFYDAGGTEVNEPTRLNYQPLPSQWSPGTNSQAFFILPQDTSRIKVISLSR